MTFYDGIYPFYPLQRSSFIIDISVLVVILVFSVLAVSFLLILPGIRGKSVSVALFCSKNVYIRNPLHIKNHLHSISSRGNHFT